MRKQKIDSFIQRMELNKRLKEEKIEAMRFITQNYDEKSSRLLFYPNSQKNKKKRTSIKEKSANFPLRASRNYHWND